MASITRLGRTIRNANRLRHIVTVLARYGFEDVVHETGVDHLIDRARQMLGMRRTEGELKHLPQPVRLRKAMEELGTTFIKLGQILSLRPDLIPPDWANEFGKLQDDVPPVEFELVRKRLEEEYPQGLDQVFASIDPQPLAAGSIAPVHRAKLIDGTDIVLKVLRPGIRDMVASDMEIMHGLAEFVEDRYADIGYSPIEVIDQFSRELTREMDLTREGRSTDRLRKAFARNQKVVFPKVYWEATTPNVLAMEFIDGIRLSRLEPGQLTPTQLREVVEVGADAVFRQCLELGFFHADPHPGNLFVLRGNRVCFIDCGMVGHIDPQSAQYLAELVHGVVTQDLDRVVQITIALGDANPGLAYDRLFRADVWDFISRFETTTLDDLDIGALLQDFFNKLSRHKLRCPADMVFLIKAITTIEGVGEKLYPEFDIVAHVRPYIERLLKRRFGWSALRRRLRDSVLTYAQLLERLPSQFSTLFFDLHRNRLTVNLKHGGFDDLMRTIDHASGSVAHSLFVASLIMGSSILVLADRIGQERGILTMVAVMGFAVAVLLLAGRFIADRFRSWHDHK